MVLTPHGGVNRCETRAGFVLRVLTCRRSALKTRHHYTTPKYTSTILAAQASYGRPRLRVRHVGKVTNKPIRTVISLLFASPRSRRNFEGSDWAGVK